MAVALDELHDQRSDGGHRSSLEESYGNVSGKKIARVVRHKFPVNYRSSFENHRPFWGMNQQFRYGENDIFSKRSKRWRGFPPAGMFVLAACRQSLGDSQGSASQVTAAPREL